MTIRPEREWGGRTVRVNEGKDITTLADPGTGGWVAQMAGARPLVSWDPPLGWDWPLTVGKTWTRKQVATVHATKVKINFEAT